MSLHETAKTSQQPRVHVEPVIDESGKPVVHRLNGPLLQLSIDGKVVIQGHDITAKLEDGTVKYWCQQTKERPVELEDGRVTTCYSIVNCQGTYRLN